MVKLGLEARSLTLETTLLLPVLGYSGKSGNSSRSKARTGKFWKLALKLKLKSLEINDLPTVMMVKQPLG